MGWKVMAEMRKLFSSCNDGKRACNGRADDDDEPLRLQGAYGIHN